MADVVVTVPKARWQEWLAEGDLPGDDATGDEYAFWIGWTAPTIYANDRVYIVAHGRLRGYAPLVRSELAVIGGVALIRAAGAVACTIDQPIRGFRGWRYVWWDRATERPFPDWRQP